MERARQAGFALPAFGRVERNDVVADLDGSYAGADLADDPCAFMAENGGELALGIEAGERVGVGVADAGRHHLDEHFARLWSPDLDRFDRQRLVGFPGDGGARTHVGSSSGSARRLQAPATRGLARSLVSVENVGGRSAAARRAEAQAAPVARASVARDCWRSTPAPPAGRAGSAAIAGRARRFRRLRTLACKGPRARADRRFQTPPPWRNGSRISASSAPTPSAQRSGSWAST